tara:strand:- start:190 stop:429 length:240 start_codon:yes stop_codon:yes gene_type:complete
MIQLLETQVVLEVELEEETDQDLVELEFNHHNLEIQELMVLVITLEALLTREVLAEVELEEALVQRETKEEVMEVLEKI